MGTPRVHDGRLNAAYSLWMEACLGLIMTAFESGFGNLPTSTTDFLAAPAFGTITTGQRIFVRSHIEDEGFGGVVYLMSGSRLVP